MEICANLIIGLSWPSFQLEKNTNFSLEEAFPNFSQMPAVIFILYLYYK